MKPANIAIALLIVLAAGLWLLTGKGWIERPEPSAAQPLTSAPSIPPPNLLRVKVATSEAADYRPTIVLRAVTYPARRLSLRAEVSGRVVELPVRKGELVARDTVIARLDVAERRSQLAEADAILAEATLARQAAGALGQQGFRAAANVAAAESALRRAEATRDRIRRDIARTHIRAPFAGILESRTIELGDVVRTASVIATLTDLDPVLIRGQVSATQRAKLTLGLEAAVEIAGAPPVAGTVRFIASSADPTTRTFTVEIAVPNPDLRWVAGLPAEATLTLPPRSAHLVPTAVLLVDDDGQTGVKTLTSDNHVRFHRVEVLNQRHHQVWVRGLPERCRVVVLGAEFIGPGQVVAPDDIGPIRIYRPA